MIRTIELATLRTPLSSTKLQNTNCYSKPVSFLTKWLHRKVLNLTEAIKERRSRDCNQLKVGRWKGPLISKGPLQLEVITYPGSGSGKKKKQRESGPVDLWVSGLIGCPCPRGGPQPDNKKWWLQLIIKCFEGINVVSYRWAAGQSSFDVERFFLRVVNGFCWEETCEG